MDKKYIYILILLVALVLLWWWLASGPAVPAPSSENANPAASESSLNQESGDLESAVVEEPDFQDVDSELNNL